MFRNRFHSAKRKSIISRNLADRAGGGRRCVCALCSAVCAVSPAPGWRRYSPLSFGSRGRCEVVGVRCTRSQHACAVAVQRTRQGPGRGGGLSLSEHAWPLPNSARLKGPKFAHMASTCANRKHEISGKWPGAQSFAVTRKMSPNFVQKFAAHVPPKFREKNRETLAWAKPHACSVGAVVPVRRADTPPVDRHSVSRWQLSEHPPGQPCIQRE